MKEQIKELCKQAEKNGSKQVIADLMSAINKKELGNPISKIILFNWLKERWDELK